MPHRSCDRSDARSYLAGMNSTTPESLLVTCARQRTEMSSRPAPDVFFESCRRTSCACEWARWLGYARVVVWARDKAASADAVKTLVRDVRATSAHGNVELAVAVDRQRDSPLAVVHILARMHEPALRTLQTKWRDRHGVEGVETMVRGGAGVIPHPPHLRWKYLS